MLVPVVKFICSTLMAIVGLLVVKNLSGSDVKLISVKNGLLMLCTFVLPGIVYDMNYTFYYTIIIYAMNIITYKIILNISFIKSIISTGIMMAFLYLLDFISSIILVMFISADQVRGTWYLNLVFNIIFAIIILRIFKKGKFSNWLMKFINKIEQKKQTRMVLFFALIIIVMNIILYLLTTDYRPGAVVIRNFLLFIIFFLLVIILLTERNSYDKLSDEYDSLFECVRVFEEWIEKEQFVRHEYKNELASIRQMTRSRKIHQKIDEIVEDIIDVDEEMIQTLKGLPNGGLKGLLYYKIIVARNRNVHLEFDISQKVYALFNSLDESKLRVLSKLVGVYCDNAIEAANDTQKKIATIEIYNLNNKINFVISNTYNIKDNLSNINEKGVSTKGEGRGNGLYYASKLLRKNNWIITKQSTIKNIYIQKVIIK